MQYDNELCKKSIHYVEFSRNKNGTLGKQLVGRSINCIGIVSLNSYGYPRAFDAIQAPKNTIRT